ncbi:hypothetical protein Dimus_024379 [Dionaea muscipula]
MTEEEVMMEVEAVQAVYAGDCTVLTSYPPHLRVHIMPRTADVSSQQFVEVDIEIRAGSLYPTDPPDINVIGSKGLDGERLKHLAASLRDKAAELSSCLMLVALCEEAVEKLSIMNHPDGDCPLCLHPLVIDDDSGSLPFMKLMSCFHCFHSECIIRWWKWLREQDESTCVNSSSGLSSFADDKRRKDSMRSCPLCRKVIHAEDIEHVINLAGSQSAQLDLDDKGVHDSENLLLGTDSETRRRRKFETLLQMQKEHGGLIEPRTDGVLFSSMSIAEFVRDAAPEVTSESVTQNQTDGEAPGTVQSGSSNRASKTRQRQRSRSGGTTKREPCGPPGRAIPGQPTTTREPYPSHSATSSRPRNTGWRKDTRTPQTHPKQWIKKGTDDNV